MCPAATRAQHRCPLHRRIASHELTCSTSDPAASQSPKATAYVRASPAVIVYAGGPAVTWPSRLRLSYSAASSSESTASGSAVPTPPSFRTTDLGARSCAPDSFRADTGARPAPRCTCGVGRCAAVTRKPRHGSRQQPAAELSGCSYDPGRATAQGGPCLPRAPGACGSLPRPTISPTHLALFASRASHRLRTQQLR